jgi:prolyl 4-hydroxylase
MTKNPVEEAQTLVSQGQAMRAAALLLAAGDAGDVDALMQLAVWNLAGVAVAQDLDAGRALLRRAVIIGHVDGALMEVALTANGNGNSRTPDWQDALALLDIAAAQDHVAAAQRALLDRMALTANGTPRQVPEPAVLRDSPRILHYPAFFTPEECAHLASASSDLLEPARIVDPQSGRLMPHPIRTSDDAAIGPLREDMVVRALNLRIAAASGTAVEQGEALTVLRYRPGQEYRPHLDTIAGAANQRIKTVLVYLNQGFGGGETSFPLLGLTIRPRIGDAIVFDTTLPDGSPDPRTRHAGTAVTAGVKWLATRWIRSAPIDPWTIAAG